ncbi:MAG: FtsB family cell division protein [Actinomycetota bacterium]
MKLRRSAVAAFTLALLVVGAAVLTNVVPYRQILEQQRQVEAASQELEDLREENEVLSAQRDALETPVEVERLAREKLGYVRPGEIAYVVLEPPPAPTTTTTLPAGEREPPPQDEALWETVWDFMTGADLRG